MDREQTSISGRDSPIRTHGGFLIITVKTTRDILKNSVLVTPDSNSNQNVNFLIVLTKRQLHPSPENQLMKNTAHDFAYSTVRRQLLDNFELTIVMSYGEIRHACASGWCRVEAVQDINITCPVVSGR